MRYSIRQVRSEPKSFAVCNYEILDGSRIVARYWHDHRGDEHGIDFVSGLSEGWPVGRMTDFLTGGGSKPVVLSVAAVAYLESKLAAQ